MSCSVLLGILHVLCVHLMLVCSIQFPNKFPQHLSLCISLECVAWHTLIVNTERVDLIIINVQLLEGIDGDQDVPYIGVDEPLLIPFPQL